jgi:class 3 adenylate cyclase/tetratricopeptide (TPR) repeat protein
MPTCPACGQENPEGFRLCGMCGAALAEAPPPTGEERKRVSVLFVDLVGFTSRFDRGDPEDVRAVLYPYHAAARREIERFDGRVEKFVGDAVMAVFGAPVAHEDDAERAVRAALRVLDAVEDLELRAAVATGEAVVTIRARPEAGEAIAAGDVVNTASRLQQVAPSGSLVVDEPTYRVTRKAIDYEQLSPVTVKGKAGPIPLWRALGARERAAVDAERALPTPFVGRQRELSLLQDVFRRTLEEPSVQLATVVGEPGVGKTRLVAEFHAFVEERPELVFWRQGRCLSYGEGVTFWALGEVVKAHAGILESDTPEAAWTKLSSSLRTLAEDASEREWLQGRLAPLVGLAGPEAAGSAEREELFAAWRRYIEAIASAQPLVLVFDDLHWADEAMLAFVEALVDWATDVPLLCLCTARPELFERSPGWGGGKRNSTTVSLVPLTSDETARLVAALLSQAVLPVETQAALLERSGGNPLYAEEFVRMLTDREILTRRGRAAELAVGAEIPVPETVQALIAARIDTLPQQRKALLHDAAVIGKVFWSGAVAAIGGVEQRLVEEELHELARKELIRPSRTSSVKEEREYSFWHVLIRDVAYGQIPRGARAQKHRAAAEWIEHLAGERLADHAELLAHHYEQALGFAAAAGSVGEAAELEPLARRFIVMAGDRARQFDAARAESYYRRALELMRPADPERADVLWKLGDILMVTGLHTEAERVIREAIADFEARGDGVGAGKALVRLCFALVFQGRTAEARSALAEGVELLERQEPGAELADAYSHMTRNVMMSGRSKECLEWSEKTLALAERLGRDDVAVLAHQFHGIARCELGDTDGIRELEEAARISLELGLAHETVRAHINLANWKWFAEGPAAGLDVECRGIDFAERRGRAGQARWARGESLWMLFDLGDWDELLRIADALIEWDREHGRSYIGTIALSYKAHVLVHRGEVTTAATLVDEFLPGARDIEDPQVLSPALVIAALVERAKGHLPKAVGLIDELEAITRGRAGSSRYWQLPEALRIALAAGARELAGRLLEGPDPYSARERHVVLTGQAIFAEANDRHDEAAALYEDAARSWAEYGFLLEEGQALFGLGRCLHRLGRSSEVRAAVADARVLFERLASRPLADETGHWLDQAVAQAAR